MVVVGAVAIRTLQRCWYCALCIVTSIIIGSGRLNISDILYTNTLFRLFLISKIRSTFSNCHGYSLSRSSTLANDSARWVTDSFLVFMFRLETDIAGLLSSRNILAQKWMSRQLFSRCLVQYIRCVFADDKNINVVVCAYRTHSDWHRFLLLFKRW